MVNSWQQGWDNLFGINNTNPMQGTATSTNNQYYQYLTDQLNVGLSEGDQGYISVEDALTSKDPKLYAKLQVADLKYDPNSSEGEGVMNKVMSDPIFMMGLSLMNQAGTGTSFQEALMPAMTQTQAFITNQELRKQNKKLTRDKTTKRITEVIGDYQGLQTGDIAVQAGEQSLTLGQLGIQNARDRNIMSGIDASLYSDEKGINLKTMKTNYDLGLVNYEMAKIALKYAPKNAALDYELKELGYDMTKIDASMYADEKQVNLDTIIANLDGTKLQNDILKVAANYAEPNAALDLITKKLNNKNIDASTKATLENTRGQVLANEMKEYYFADEKEKDAMFKNNVAQLVRTKVISEKEAEKIYLNGRDNWDGTAGLQASDSEVAEVRRYMDDVGMDWYDSLPFVGLNDDDFDAIRMIIDEEMVRTVKKLTPDGTFDSTYIPKAQKILANNNFIKTNSKWEQIFLFKDKYTVGDTSRYELEGGSMNFERQQFIPNGQAQGGPVQAGQTYTVGEHGPETFVPKQDGSIVSNPRTKGGYTWEEAIIDSSEMLTKIKNASGIAEAKKALRKFRPDLYV